ncbi:uncharacterized protein Gasu_03090 [Galdieria sulphuraria]|uniref:Integral membrane bound transporter domain-containing protein n=1 Tax=Galdieria sulphuraria TaxID=130081 RepID=M2Y9I7_GALSU|nr:uncharacterized protein Gasu_03090 [Galdieria sulphuraria]EME32534.1 hypothetical protein Gasu_03090 [Galdieria sulphuraria]|eukprot:XP_005709054.1 hypothetical protein Gasu_03090 [Galdieria sulphuraria]
MEFSENTFKLACRATVGFLLLSVLVFTQKFYHLEYGPLAIIMFLCSITFSSDQLEFGFVSLGCLQSTASLLFGASFGYIAAWISGNSNLLTVVSAAIGTGLFTALHPYQKISFITSNGEIYFIFNLLDSKKSADSNILWNTFYETMIGALLAHMTALLVSIAIFPKSIHREMFHCLSLSFDYAGSVLSKAATLLLHCFAEGNKELISLELSQDMQQHWNQAKGYFEKAQAMRKCLLFEWNVRYPTSQEANGVYLESLMNEWQSFLDTLQALQILVTKGQKRYSDEILLQWKSFMDWLQIYFAWMASKCHRYSMISEIHNNRPKLLQLWQIENTKESQEWLQPNDSLSFRFHQAFREYFQAVSKNEISNLSIFDHGPLMYFMVITNTLKDHMEMLDRNLNELAQMEPCSVWRRFQFQIVSTLDVLAWPFYGWLNVFKAIPKGCLEWKALVKNNQFQFFLKKWLVSLSILTFLLASPFYEQFANFNGAWLWLSYILYMQPSTEGTLMNGIANILGVFFACLASALIMLRPSIATNGYLLDAYLTVITFITVLFLTSPISETLLTFSFTEYVLILYYFNPYEFHETWRYSLTRFLQILLGIIIAVLMNTWILTFSALEETTSCLSSLLEKMVSSHAMLGTSDYVVLEHAEKTYHQLNLNSMWKEFSYISSVLDSICSGILETTGVSVVSKEILTVVRVEEDLLHRLKALVIVSRGLPLLKNCIPFHSKFFSFMKDALSEDWSTLSLLTQQLTSLVEHKLKHTETFRCSEFLKDLTQQAQKRITDVAQEVSVNAIQGVTHNILTGLENCIDIWSNNPHHDMSSSLPSDNDTREEAHDRVSDWLSLLSISIIEQWKRHFPIQDTVMTDHSQDVTLKWMTPSLAKAYIEILERGEELSKENDAHHWLECKKAFLGMRHFKGKLTRNPFGRLPNGHRSILFQRMKKLKMNKCGLSQVSQLTRMEYQTFPIIETTWNDRVQLCIREWKRAQGILYLHCMYLEWHFLKGLLPLEEGHEVIEEPLYILYGDEYIDWLARLFASAYFMEGLISLAIELTRIS